MPYPVPIRAIGPQATRSETARGWRSVWLALFVVAFGAGVPVPLFLVYREDLGLSTTTITLAFGVYALGLIPTVFLSGSASDRHGRRRLVLPFVALSAIASLVLMAADATTVALFVGRFLQGMASGVVFGVGSAWLQELSRNDGHGRAGRRATSALSAGFALGPLVAGVLAAWAPAPLILPYVVQIAMSAIAIARVSTALDGSPLGDRQPLVNLGVPRDARRQFLVVVVPLALWVFTLPSTAINALPVMVSGDDAGISSSRVAFAGLVAATTMLAGAFVQPLGRHSVRRAATVGLGAGAAGLALGIAAVSLPSWLLLLPVGSLLGGAYGLCLAAGLTEVDTIADPPSRGALTATFYALTYLGLGAPFVVTELSAAVGATAALTATAVLAAATAAWMSTTRATRR